jgi:hypothetical protein
VSKVTEELDFMWPERILDYYRQLEERYAYEKDVILLEKMITIAVVLKLQGLYVKGVDI